MESIWKKQQEQREKDALEHLEKSKDYGIQAIENVRRRNEKMLELIREVEIEQKVQREVARKSSTREQEEQLARKHYKH